MTALTADAIRAAKQRLYRYGLRTDGAYGEPDGPCCTVGHIAVAVGRFECAPGIDGVVPSEKRDELLIDDLFQEWNPSAACTVWAWNDSLEPRLAVPAVSAFYGWLEQRAEAKGALT